MAEYAIIDESEVPAQHKPSASRLESGILFTAEIRSNRYELDHVWRFRTRLMTVPAVSHEEVHCITASSFESRPS
jgi:hypothetical protein